MTVTSPGSVRNRCCALAATAATNTIRSCHCMVWLSWLLGRGGNMLLYSGNITRYRLQSPNITNTNITTIGTAEQI